MVFLKNIRDVDKLRDAISMCRGDVILRSADGKEELNLKSQLSQYIAIERLHRECGDEYEFFCMDHRDEAIMLKFFGLMKDQHEIEAGDYMLKNNSVQAFRFDGDIINRNDGTYYVPDWAIKAYKDRKMYFGSTETGGPYNALFVANGDMTIPVNVGDYIVQLSDNSDLMVVSPSAMEVLFERRP